MTRANILKVLCLIAVFAFMFSALSAFAQNNTNADVTCAKYNYPWCDKTGSNPDPGGLVKNFYTTALGLAAASAMGVLIFGAILWTMSGAVTSKKDAMDWIWGAIWGFVLLLAAALILGTINQSLLNLTSPTMPTGTGIESYGF